MTDMNLFQTLTVDEIVTPRRVDASAGDLVVRLPPLLSMRGLRGRAVVLRRWDATAHAVTIRPALADEGRTTFCAVGDTGLESVTLAVGAGPVMFLPSPREWQWWQFGGAVAAKGSPGKDGNTPTVTVSGTTTLAPGQPATVTPGGTPTDLTLAFGLPQGVKGDKGDKGNKGDTGASFNVAGPVNQTFTPGAAFQPREDGPCRLTVTAALTGIIGINGAVTLGVCATSNGTFVNVGPVGLAITVLNIPAGAALSFDVPTGWFAKIVLTGNVTAKCLRTNL